MKPLEGVRIVDFTMGWSGPLATRHLADMGAEVIKIEACRYADWWRGWEHTEATLREMQHETVPAFNEMNRNKLGITLDLTTARGKELVLQLVARADGVVENQSATVMPRLGLGWDVLRAANPKLVMVSMPAYGTTGPWSEYRGYGSTVEHGAGLPHLTGEPDGPPIQTHIAYGDACAGLNAAAAMLTGLYHARRSGEGQHVNLAQVEGMLQQGMHGPIHHGLTGTLPPRTGNRHPLHAPHGVWRCAGADDWLLVAVTAETEWTALCSVIGRPDLAGKDRFAVQDVVDAALAAWAMAQTATEAAELLQQAGVPAARVARADELGSDPQLLARGLWVEMERAHVGRMPHPAAPYLMDGARLAIEWPSPTLGEHNDRVLGEILGLDAAARARLAADGVIGTVPFVPKAAAVRAG